MCPATDENQFLEPRFQGFDESYKRFEFRFRFQRFSLGREQGPESFAKSHPLAPSLVRDGARHQATPGVRRKQERRRSEQRRDIFTDDFSYGGEGGLYCAFFHNFIVFCHFIRKTRVFFRLWPSLSSLIRLSSAFQSLLWTSKVPKKSNMSNKSRFLSWVYGGLERDSR